MQIKNRLDVCLSKCPVTGFPDKFKYPSRYDGIVDALKPYHRDVDVGAIVAQIEDGTLSSDSMYLLTHHGADHVETVIERATNILRSSAADISPYELYLLLVAIQIHDIGNIAGRDGHMSYARKVMEDLGEVAGFNTSEKLVIIQIAEAHAAGIDGEKDTLSQLPSDDKNLVATKDRVRMPFLAAVLRLADELAEEQSRASVVLLKDGKVPKTSEVYHQFCKCINPVKIENNQISLSFDMSPKEATTRYGKGKKTVYLVDEILDRTLKTHLERIYCTRFLRQGDVNIERIAVSIQVLDAGFKKEPELVAYRLENAGYPAIGSKGIHGLCRDLEGITGRTFNEKVRKKWKVK